MTIKSLIAYCPECGTRTLHVFFEYRNGKPYYVCSECGYIHSIPSYEVEMAVETEKKRIVDKMALRIDYATSDLENVEKMLGEVPDGEKLKYRVKMIIAELETLRDEIKRLKHK
jgi:ribosomal protein L37AE/L43A